MSDIDKIKQELKKLNLEYAKIKDLAPEERKDFGIKLNKKREELNRKLQEAIDSAEAGEVSPIDITAPTGINQDVKSIPRGTRHPLMTELDTVAEIYNKMGFNVIEAQQLDDEYHMFESLNFPEGHHYIVGAQYWVGENGEAVTDDASGQKLFIPVSNTKLMINM